ncbi:uncharacterized protein [Halyomorpha halys]|uniref:uncharacterized protein n=1 Tax=Halyomorpha halys TaxID=286706 RepID=UPI0006D4D196|nr:uncharacterized protein LOC106681742 [Halyomorpha halys]
MFWILFIGCLIAAIGDGEANSGLESSAYFKQLVEFFNDLFYFRSGHPDDGHLYFEGDFDDEQGELKGKAKVSITAGSNLINNEMISYPDSNTKLCTMELRWNGITVEITNGSKYLLSQCNMLLQFSVSNKTGVTIKPEMVFLYGCTVEQDGALSLRPTEVTQSVSNFLKKQADEYLTHQYNSADSFSYDYYKINGPDKDQFEDILYTVSISAGEY